MSWSYESGQGNAFLGWSVGSAGDVNGDGFDDALVAAPYWDQGTTDEGIVHVFHGSAAGLGPAPAASVEGNGYRMALGTSAASAGDVNGDGFDDVILGAPAWDYDRGRAVLHLGSAAGLRAVSAWTGSPPSYSNFQFGASVSSAGDVNGDGFDDVIVGAPGGSDGEGYEGTAYVYLGRAGGLAPTPIWSAGGDVAEAGFGESVGSAGDVDGDGFDDVIVGAWRLDGLVSQGGRALVFRGSATGVEAAPSWTMDGTQASEAFGSAVVGAGDVNGDGYDDIVVGADHHDRAYNDEGAAFLYLGSRTGPARTPAWTRTGGEASAFFGEIFGAAGDVNGDGRDDLVVGSWFFSNPQTFEGGAWLFLGSPRGLSSLPAWAAESNQVNASLGQGLGAGGDVDGDGFDDVLIGLPGYTNGQIGEGAAILVPGAALADGDLDGAPDVVDVCPTAADPAQLDADGDTVGNACDAPGLVVSGELTPGGAMVLVAVGVAPQETVSFAGAPGTGGVGPCPAALGGECLHLGPGAALLGSDVADAAGIARLTLVVPPFQVGGRYVVQAAVPRGANSVVTPVVVLDGARLDWDGDQVPDDVEGALGTDPRLADTDGDGVEDGVELCLVGPDPDADGVPDVCDNCPSHPNPGQEDHDADGEGNACTVLLGPVTVVESAVDTDSFGFALSGAGDVNGDGLADLVVGAFGHSNPAFQQGRADVYLGSAAGIGLSPDWSVEALSDHDQLGYAVASAGDVNADGFGDVILGAPGFRSGQQTQEGAAVLFLGSPAGLGATPAWMRQGNVVGAHLGIAVAGAGDVDGDGRDDVVLGDGLGRVSLHLGSPTGLRTLPSWTSAADPAAGLGRAVAGAGDVDGDGFADVAAGAWSGEDGELDEGLAHVWLGSPTGPISQLPDWTAGGDQAGAGFGWSVAGAGDLDGDGFDDLAVGAPQYDSAHASSGGVFVFLGSATGLPSAPSWSADGGPSAYNTGTSVACAGDLDGDGFDDLVVGVPSYSHTRSGEGAALVYPGSPDGPTTLPVWMSPGTGSEFTNLGDSVAGVGDLDGNGLDDVAVGMPNRAETWLFLAP